MRALMRFRTQQYLMTIRWQHGKLSLRQQLFRGGAIALCQQPAQ